MSKVFKAVGQVAGVLAIIPSPIQPFAAAVAAVATTAAALTAKKPKSYATGSISNVVIGANQPIPYLMGTTYSEGSEIHDNGYGNRVGDVDNPYRFRVRVYSGCGPVEQLVSTQVDFETIPFSGNAATGYYAGFLYRDAQLGATPEPDALAPQWSGDSKWSTAHKLSGYAAIGWSQKFDKDGKRWASGVPRLGSVWKGVWAYDPRLDSTYPGGSGAHRIDDETTWGWTDNPALHAGTYAYGRYHNGIKVFGVDLGEAAVEFADVVAWANVCDANGWKIGGPVYEPSDKWNNLKLIAQAGAGEPVLTGGLLKFRFNSSKVSLDTITAADLADGDLSIPATRRWKERINGVIPKYRSADHQWEYVPIDVVTSSIYTDEDGEEKFEERQLDLVQDKDQAAQIGGYILSDAREFGPIVLSCKPRLIEYKPGDALTLDLPDDGLNEQLCVVIARSVDPGTGIVQLTFVTETTAKHAFALGQTGIAPPTPSLTSAEARDGTVKINLAQTAPLFDVTVEYDLGRIVSLADRSTWLYIYATANTGNVPATGSDYWLQLTPPLLATDIGVDDGATRNTDVFNDDMDYADMAAFLRRWTAVSPNTEGNIAPVSDSAAPGGTAMEFSAPTSGGGDPITSGSMSSSSLHANTTGNSIAALSDGVFNTGASSMGTEAETDPYIIRDLGSVQSVGNIQFAPISSDVEGPLDGAFLTGTLTATSNYGGYSPALPNDGAHLRNGLFSGYDNYHACDTDSSAPTMTYTLASDQYCSVIKIGPVNSGDPQAWSPVWMDGTAVKTKPAAGSFTTRGTASGSANNTLQSFNVDATIGVVTLSRTAAYMAVSELHVLGRKRFSLGALDGVKVRISSLTSPDPTDAGDWTDVATVSGSTEGALSTLGIDASCRHIQFIHIGSNKAVGLSELIVKDPVLGGDTSDSLEFESNFDLLLNPLADNRFEIVAAGVSTTANNFEAGISVFDGSSTRTRLNVAANQADVPTGYTRFVGYFKVATGSAVEPAPDPTAPCLMPSGAIKAKARFLCDTGNSDFVRIASIKIREIADRTSEAGADKTATQQISISVTALKTISANHLGVVASGTYPIVFSPTVKRNGVSIRGADNVSYAISYDTGAGTASVDNTNGSATKGDCSISAVTGDELTVTLTVTVDSVAQAPVSFTLKKDKAAAPAPSTKISSKTASGSLTSTSFVEVAHFGDLTVASGESLYGTGTMGYQVTGDTSGARTGYSKYQYYAGSVWNDFASEKTGSSSESGYAYGDPYEPNYQEPVKGYVDTAQTKATPGAGTYPVRLVARLNTSGKTANVDGNVQVEAKV